jgi:hypothetical protein
MRRTPLLFVIILSAVLPLLAAPPQQESLGDLARQLRDQHDKDAKKAAKVFTNDNLPAPKPGETISSSPAPPENPSTPAQTASKSGNTPSSKETGDQAGDKAMTRDYWQGKFKAARQNLSQAKEHQQLAEDEMNLLQIQQARELDQNIKQDLTNKIQNKQSEVDVDRAATAAAQKALDDLDKEFKDSGAQDDWSHTD